MGVAILHAWGSVAAGGGGYTRYSCMAVIVRTHVCGRAGCYALASKSYPCLAVCSVVAGGSCVVAKRGGSTNLLLALVI